jgi:hypothetical protein
VPELYCIPEGVHSETAAGPVKLVRVADTSEEKPSTHSKFPAEVTLIGSIVIRIDKNRKFWKTAETEFVRGNIAGEMRTEEGTELPMVNVYR